MGRQSDYSDLSLTTTAIRWNAVMEVQGKHEGSLANPGLNDQ